MIDIRELAERRIPEGYVCLIRVREHYSLLCLPIEVEVDGCPVKLVAPISHSDPEKVKRVIPRAINQSNGTLSVSNFKVIFITAIEVQELRGYENMCELCKVLWHRSMH